MSAFIFYLDGTLVETERLKVLPYAEVVGRLTGPNTLDGRAVELYERIVGSTDEIGCRQVIDEFNLASAPGSSDLADGTDSEHCKELHRLRMDKYRENHGALGRLQANAYQHNVDLLRHQKSIRRTVSVATSSFTDEARRVLDVFGLRVLLDDVVIIEDSPIGTRASMASGAAWICVSTAFPRPAIDAVPWIDRRWTVHDPVKLGETVACRIELIEQG